MVKERDGACVECGRHGLLHYDHNPPFHHTRRTVIDELEASGPADMGRVMKEIMPRVAGQADGSRVSALVKQLLKP